MDNLRSLKIGPRAVLLASPDPIGDISEKWPHRSPVEALVSCFNILSYNSFFFWSKVHMENPRAARVTGRGSLVKEFSNS